MTKLKALLDDKKASAEALARAVALLGDEGVPALKRAAKGSKRREDVRVRVLLVLGDRTAGDALPKPKGLLQPPELRRL